MTQPGGLSARSPASWDRPGPRLGLVLALTLGCVLAYAADLDSPVRVVLALGFSLFAPGLAFAELLGLPTTAQRVALATAASLGIETLVAVALIYAGAYSVGLALGIVAGLTVAVAAVAWRRGGR